MNREELVKVLESEGRDKINSLVKQMNAVQLEWLLVALSCENCGRLPQQHANSQCLFDKTTYKATTMPVAMAMSNDYSTFQLLLGRIINE